MRVVGWRCVGLHNVIAIIAESILRMASYDLSLEWRALLHYPALVVKMRRRDSIVRATAHGDAVGLAPITLYRAPSRLWLAAVYHYISS